MTLRYAKLTQFSGTMERAIQVAIVDEDSSLVLKAKSFNELKGKMLGEENPDARSKLFQLFENQLIQGFLETYVANKEWKKGQITEWFVEKDEKVPFVVFFEEFFGAKVDSYFGETGTGLLKEHLAKCIQSLDAMLPDEGARKFTKEELVAQHENLAGVARGEEDAPSDLLLKMYDVSKALVEELLVLLENDLTALDHIEAKIKFIEDSQFAAARPETSRLPFMASPGDLGKIRGRKTVVEGLEPNKNAAYRIRDGLKVRLGVVVSTMEYLLPFVPEQSTYVSQLTKRCKEFNTVMQAKNTLFQRYYPDVENEVQAVDIDQFNKAVVDSSALWLNFLGLPEDQLQKGAGCTSTSYSWSGLSLFGRSVPVAEAQSGAKVSVSENISYDSVKAGSQPGRIVEAAGGPK